MSGVKRKTSSIGVLLMLICAVCLYVGQFIWKLYDGLLPPIIGFGIYGLGALAMLYTYRFGGFSVLQPINSVSYVIVAIFGNIFSVKGSRWERRLASRRLWRDIVCTLRYDESVSPKATTLFYCSAIRVVDLYLDVRNCI